MSFKDKPLKKINGDNRVTIDVLHNDLIKSFNNENDEMGDFEEQINILKEEYDNSNDERILLKIDKLKDRLKNYNKNKKQNYYLDNGENTMIKKLK